MKIKYFDITRPGLSVKCKLYSGESHTPSFVVVCCHGFGGSKDSAAIQKLADTLLPVHRDGAILAFDLPCHGDDVKQKLDLEDCGRYLDAVVGFSRDDLGAKRLVCFATSFGGYLVLREMHRGVCPFEKVLLRCPAVGIHQVLLGQIEAKGQLGLLPKKEAVLGFDRSIKVSARFLEQLSDNDISLWDYSDLAQRLLILHGTKDEMVPHDTVEAFARKNGIDFLSIENADHRFRDPSKMREVLDYAAEFFFT